MVVPTEEEVAHRSIYGINWDIMDNQTLMYHHLKQNLEEWADDNPFVPNTQDLSEVLYKLPNSPFLAAQIESRETMGD
jgi:hypothetical protein